MAKQLSFTELNGRKDNFNYGNKTGRICYSIGEGKTATAVAYAMEERENRNDPSGSPLLYFVCEYGQQKGFTVKCNDADHVAFILQNPRERYNVQFLVRTFEADGRKTIYPEMTKID